MANNYYAIILGLVSLVSSILYFFGIISLRKDKKKFAEFAKAYNNNEADLYYLKKIIKIIFALFSLIIITIIIIALVTL